MSERHPTEAERQAAFDALDDKSRWDEVLAEMIAKETK